jgi:hypothetical protein
MLLRACAKRPNRRRAERRDELTPPHSITSSARARRRIDPLIPCVRTACTISKGEKSRLPKPE